jgi:hypothetical protein
MEFSYKVTESEFREAWRVERKASSRSSLKTAAFWMLIMFALLLLYLVVQPAKSPGVAEQRRVMQSSMANAANQSTLPSDYLENVGPFLVIAGVWILVVKGLVPMRLRYLYRRDPRMQGQFTVDITKDSISTENTAGTTSKSTWNVYDYWCEGKGVIVLMFNSCAYSVLSIAGLSEPQRGELRGILSTVLPKR